ncbi:hypothetical protein DD594_26145, partial [Enterobacter cloacae complex sp. 4DZ1-17B1]|uniref:hypothetical protein n=1 Tax=Enterobacter cloacae complex sp. 4DZ1-17B1 TaxID=2511991 RepID=UPI00102713AA
KKTFTQRERDTNKAIRMFNHLNRARNTGDQELNDGFETMREALGKWETWGYIDSSRRAALQAEIDHLLVCKRTINLVDISGSNVVED